MISNNSTPVNEFSPTLWNHLVQTIEKVAREKATQGGGRPIAAFDADGTLWDADAGETFFDWQIHHAGLKGLPADPWAHYHDLKKVNPTVAYVWLAQISAGRSLEQVRGWAERCFREGPTWPVFASQRRLIELLRANDFEIYIVTASIKWAVEPVASLLGIDFDHVLGITTKLTADREIGLEAVQPITWRQGKADGLLHATGGIRPALACGNTLGDIALLGTATHVQLAVSTQNEPGGLFDEEAKLRDEADRRGWLKHAFR